MREALRKPEKGLEKWREGITIVSLSRHADSAADSAILGQADSAPEKVAPEWRLGRKRGGEKGGKKGLETEVGKGVGKEVGKRVGKGLEKGWEKGMKRDGKRDRKSGGKKVVGK